MLLTFVGLAQSQPELDYRWFYVGQNLQVEENVGKVEALLKRAKAAGYNGMVLADYKLSILDQVPDFYAKNLGRVLKTAKELGVEVIPSVFGVGYAGGLLSHDPNLAEGMPVRNLSLTVRGGVLTLARSDEPASVNLDFEDSQGDRMAGWSFQDGVGQWTFADRETVKSGRQSLRMQEIGNGNPESGNSRVHQVVQVQPWHEYRASVWIKTQGFDRAGNARIAVLTESGKSVSFSELGVQPTQDWRLHHIVFNSQDNAKLRLYFGVWGGRNGKIWWDGATLQCAPFLNVLRRPGCPLTLTSGGKALKEGVDFERIEDPKLGRVPWPGGFEVAHDPPPVKVLDKALEGTTLRADYFHLAMTLEDQVAICLSEPKSRELLSQEVERVGKLMNSSSYFMAHDEIRVANWCSLCQASRKTPGQQLAANARFCFEAIKKLNPKAQVFVWSDMFDPNHNAHGDYYLVNGSWEGSWNGLDKDVVIVDWYFDARKQTLPFFQNRGHRQILAGYYDGPVDTIKTWLADAKNYPGVCGVMYTTWVNDYSNLEAFAKAAWGG